MFRKKRLPTHDDTPSKPLPPKEIKSRVPNYEGKVRESKHNDGEKGTPLPPKVVETQEPNYEGRVRETNYQVEEVKPDLRGTLPESKSGERSTYPIDETDIDVYAVDLRIWERMVNYLNSFGGGGGGGPHTHDGLYAEVTHDHPGLAPDGHDHPHNHDGDYAPSTHDHDALYKHDHPYASDKHKHDADYADKQAFEDHLANHPDGGGGGGGTIETISDFRFVRGQDGARWDNGGDGVSSTGFLPAYDADGKLFDPGTPRYEVKVADENGNFVSWSNFKADPVSGGFDLEFEAWGVLDGNELLFDASRVIVNNSYLYEKTEELDENKADKEHEHDVLPHYHNYDGSLAGSEGDWEPHTHDGVYEVVGHTHPEAPHTHDDYELVGHTHDGYSSTAHFHPEHPALDHTHELEAHNHDGLYAGKSHAHTSYSEKDHTHDSVPSHNHPHNHDTDYAGKIHTHTDVPAHNHSDYVKKDGTSTMTGPLVVNKSNASSVFEGKTNNSLKVKIWSDGTIEQIPHLSNAKDEHVITRRNLNNALSGYSPTNHEHADSEDRNFAALGGQNYTSYYGISDVNVNRPWFMPLRGGSDNASNNWPGNCDHLRLFYDNTQHNLEPTGGGTILIKDDNGLLWFHGVVSGLPVRVYPQSKHAYNIPVEKVTASGSEWNWNTDYTIYLSGVFWE